MPKKTRKDRADKALPQTKSVIPQEIEVDLEPRVTPHVLMSPTMPAQGTLQYYLLKEKPEDYEYLLIAVEDLQPMEGIVSCRYEANYEKGILEFRRALGSLPRVEVNGTEVCARYFLQGDCIVGITWDKIGRPLGFMANEINENIEISAGMFDGKLEEILRFHPGKIYPWRLL